jgi:hypothetical protein
MEDLLAKLGNLCAKIFFPGVISGSPVHDFLLIVIFSQIFIHCRGQLGQGVGRGVLEGPGAEQRGLSQGGYLEGGVKKMQRYFALAAFYQRHFSGFKLLVFAKYNTMWKTFLPHPCVGGGGGNW